MNNTKKIKIKFFKKKDVSDVEVKCVYELNIGEKIENINLYIFCRFLSNYLINFVCSIANTRSHN